MRRYAEHLQLCEEADPESRDKLAQLYCRGWFIGSKEKKKALSEDLNEKHPDVNWQGSDLKELNEMQWEALVKSLLKAAGRTEEDIEYSKKGVLWKAHIAKQLRVQTTAGNPWIARPHHLQLGRAQPANCSGRAGHVVNVKIFLTLTHNVATDHPQSTFPIDRPDWLALLRSPLAITDLAVLPAQLNFMSSFQNRFQNRSNCSATKTWRPLRFTPK